MLKGVDAAAVGRGLMDRKSADAARKPTCAAPHANPKEERKGRGWSKRRAVEG